MDKQQQYHIWYFVAAFLALLAFQSWLSTAAVTERIPYSAFLEHLEADRIATLTVRAEQIEGRYRDPVGGTTHFVTNIVPDDLTTRLERSTAEFDGTVQNTFLTMLLSWVVPIALILFVWLYVFRRFAERQGLGGMMNVGKSKAKVYVERDTGVTFDDVAGVDEAKAELKEIVDFLKQPEKFGRLGARIPKGILLTGPPGTGKTLFARAIAGEAGVPFFSISGSEFVEMFVGVGAARVRDLFEQARTAAPCIIFIDELDALGKRRGIGNFGGGHDEKEQTLNQLLAELDGFDPREGIVLLAATNRPEILDPALMRAGRFDRQVVVDRPDKTGRAAILRVHLRKVQVDPALDVEAVAGLTPGFTGAELANLVNEAAIQATRREADRLTIDDITRALERIVAGMERKGRLPAFRLHLLVIADHEIDFAHRGEHVRVHLRRASRHDDAGGRVFAARLADCLPRLAFGFRRHRAGVEDDGIAEPRRFGMGAHHFRLIGVEAAAEGDDLGPLRHALPVRSAGSSVPS